MRAADVTPFKDWTAAAISIQVSDQVLSQNLIILVSKQRRANTLLTERYLRVHRPSFYTTIQLAPECFQCDSIIVIDIS